MQRVQGNAKGNERDKEDREIKRNISLKTFIIFFFFFQLGPVHTPRAPPVEGVEVFRVACLPSIGTQILKLGVARFDGHEMAGI